jgi:hypothetical protein
MYVSLRVVERELHVDIVMLRPFTLQICGRQRSRGVEMV